MEKITIAKYEYDAIMRILAALPRCQGQTIALTTKEQNALRKAHLLNKKLKAKKLDNIDGPNKNDKA